MYHSTSMNIGFSPCPNDTFIFDALINNRIDTEGLAFNPLIADVEKLNRKAFSKELPITKLSYFAYAFLTAQYVALSAGSALGNGCGPILISKKGSHTGPIDSLKIGIPGRYTTANLLLSLAFPKASNKHEMLFSQIESAVLSGEIDAGLVIHENRFTYQAKGLVKLIDLGAWWEDTSGSPVPLGGIFIRRDACPELAQSVNRLLHASVKYAIDYPAKSKPFIKRFASDMDDSVIDQHIDLYVNHFSLNLGKTGRDAVTTLFNRAIERKIIPKVHPSLFI